MYLLRLHNGEPLYETIGRIVNSGTDESEGFR